MSYPNDRKYSQEHEWARPEGDEFVIGITHYAQDSLGDVVFVELPEEGDEVVAGESFGSVESTKAVSELFAPISGTIVAVNSPVEDAPETVNVDPHGEGWLIRVKPSDTAEYDKLLDGAAYQEFLDKES